MPGGFDRRSGVSPQVAHGLSALHADGGLHRNITARSVYLDEMGRAKLGGYQFLKVCGPAHILHVERE